MMAEIRKSTPTGPEDAVKSVVPAGRLADPLELARVIAFLLSDEASFVNGAAYTVDGGWISGY